MVAGGVPGWVCRLCTRRPGRRRDPSDRRRDTSDRRRDPSDRRRDPSDMSRDPSGRRRDPCGCRRSNRSWRSASSLGLINQVPPRWCMGGHHEYRGRHRAEQPRAIRAIVMVMVMAMVSVTRVAKLVGIQGLGCAI